MGKDTGIVLPGTIVLYDKPLMPYNDTHKHPDFEDSEQRVATFCYSRPMLQLRKKEFADAGFLYSDRLDCVCCFHCGVTLKDWDRADDPRQTHRQFSPSCQFVTDCLELQSTHSVTSFTPMEGAMCSVRYSIKTHRLQSLNCWSLPTAIKEKLATEGFYYTGFDDYVACACCYIKKHMHPDFAIDYTHRPGCFYSSDDQARGSHRDTIPQPNTCIMCENNKPTMVFLPCNHFSMCVHCARDASVCPLCATNVQQKIKPVLVQYAMVCS